LLFDGRFAEDFKLSSGTWVSVGPLRAKILAAAEGCAQDAVIAAPDREFVAALIFPNLALCRDLCADLGEAAPVRAVLNHPNVRAKLRAALDAVARGSTGNSRVVERALLLEEPPSIDAREITDKGSINQKAVLEHRSALVEELYAESPSPRTICTSVSATS
jgi:feruloyl-CoA synthase